MQNLSEILKAKEPKKRIGAKYSWQDMASRYADKLGVTKNASWFKFFKNGDKALLTATYSSMADIYPPDPEKYFYKVYWNKLNEKNS